MLVVCEADGDVSEYDDATQESLAADVAWAAGLPASRVNTHVESSSVGSVILTFVVLVPLSASVTDAEEGVRTHMDTPEKASALLGISVSTVRISSTIADETGIDATGSGGGGGVSIGVIAGAAGGAAALCLLVALLCWRSRRSDGSGAIEEPPRRPIHFVQHPTGNTSGRVMLPTLRGTMVGSMRMRNSPAPSPAQGEHSGTMDEATRARGVSQTSAYDLRADPPPSKGPHPDLVKGESSSRGGSSFFSLRPAQSTVGALPRRSLFSNRRAPVGDPRLADREYSANQYSPRGGSVPVHLTAQGGAPSLRPVRGIGGRDGRSDTANTEFSDTAFSATAYI